MISCDVLICYSLTFNHFSRETTINSKNNGWIERMAFFAKSDSEFHTQWWSCPVERILTRRYSLIVINESIRISYRNAPYWVISLISNACDNCSIDSLIFALYGNIHIYSLTYLPVWRVNDKWRNMTSITCAMHTLHGPLAHLMNSCSVMASSGDCRHAASHIMSCC